VEARAPTPAEELKTLAEVECLKADSYKAQTEAKEAVARTRKVDAETRKALADARQAEIGLAEAEDDEKARKAADSQHHVYAFVGVVDATSVKNCMRQLTQWHRNDPECDIEIVFNSPGGGIVDGMALYDFIQLLRSQGHRITTTALGMAASMAGILLQAGDVRAMGAESWLLIHEASFGTMGKTTDIEDAVAWIKKVQRRILRIFASRSNLSERQLSNRWNRKDWWLDSTEALALGLIDQIQGQPKPKRRKRTA
jgi:ATP-dependent Clp endopeptidase proteolytic subunit ClpP